MAEYLLIPGDKLDASSAGIAGFAPGEDIVLSFDILRAWQRSARSDGTPVVTLDVEPSIGGRKRLLADDGTWADVLDTLIQGGGGGSGALTYDYVKESGYLNLPATYTRVAELSIDRPAGVYDFYFSTTWRYTVANASVFFRFSIDNGSTWSELIHEVPDVTDVVPWMYGYPVEYAGGPATLIVEVRKETTAGTFDVTFVDIVFEAKILP